MFFYFFAVKEFANFIARDVTRHSDGKISCQSRGLDFSQPEGASSRAFDHARSKTEKI
jgi:hypothetical protein